MLRPPTRRFRALLPWAVGPLLGMTAVAWAAARPPIPIPLAPTPAARLVAGLPAQGGAGTPEFVIQPADVDPKFVVPKSADLDPKIVVSKAADVDPKIVAGRAPGTLDHR